MSKVALLDSVVAKRRRRGQVVKTTIFCRENGLLKETKSELEHAIAETERPLRYLKFCTKMEFCIPTLDRINNECVKNREARISIDLVKDEVENSLEREVENIKTYQQRMQKMLAKVRSQSMANDEDSSFVCAGEPTNRNKPLDARQTAR